MKRLTTIFISFFLMFNVVNATAGGGHYHGPMGKADAAWTAKRVVSGLVRQKNLEQSWAKSPMQSIKKVRVEGDLVWLAKFTNSQVTMPGKQNLDVLLTLTGSFIKADYTGK
ncbi:MAG: hypothetical protein HQL46_16860 [Gammaproteobacteria bacterium]|nr:hypothetical protein [Gammaproteobacteria bacterium]